MPHVTSSDQNGSHPARNAHLNSHAREDPRQHSWLVDVPDVALTEVAELIESAPEARFLLLNGLGYVNTPLDRRRFLVGSTAAGIGLALHPGAVAASGTSAELELS